MSVYTPVFVSIFLVFVANILLVAKVPHATQYYKILKFRSFAFAAPKKTFQRLYKENFTALYSYLCLSAQCLKRKKLNTITSEVFLFTTSFYYKVISKQMVACFNVKWCRVLTQYAKFDLLELNANNGVITYE